MSPRNPLNSVPATGYNEMRPEMPEPLKRE